MAKPYRRVAVALALAVLAAGCGSDDEEERSASPETQAQTKTQDQPAVSDQTQVRNLGTKYLRAYARKDWDTVCATLSPRARARFKRKAGSCQKVYRQAPAKSVQLAKDQHILDVKVSGDRATMTIGTYVSDRIEGRMYAAKLDGEWFLYIKRAAKGAP